MSFMPVFAKRLKSSAFFCALLTSILLVIPIIFSRPVRYAYSSLIDRQLAKVVSPQFVFAGDSLTADGNWGWLLTQNPFSAANLAKPGASINEVAVQVMKASAFRPQVLGISAGTNDVVTYKRKIKQIVCSYELLLDTIQAGQRTIVTLIPYTSFPEHSESILAANVEIRALTERGKFDVIDLNPLISTNGILDKEFTTDGVHFNQRGYEVWSIEIRKSLKQ